MSRWPTALTDLLGVAYPIVQAPMAGFSMHPLAIAVANAGGLGSLGTAVSTTDHWRAEIEAMRGATNRAFGVNFFVHAPPADDPARTARMRARLAPYYAEIGREPAASPPGGPCDRGNPCTRPWISAPWTPRIAWTRGVTMEPKSRPLVDAMRPP